MKSFASKKKYIKSRDNININIAITEKVRNDQSFKVCISTADRDDFELSTGTPWFAKLFSWLILCSQELKTFSE